MGLFVNSNKKIKAAHDYTLLMLEVPRTNDKKELAAEQMLAALHGILRTKRELKLSGTLQEHISLEIVAIGQRIRFFIWTPKHLQAFVEGQVYAQYPTVQIFEQDEDYADRKLNQTVVHTTELVLTADETIPIKTFPSFEVDPLAAITATLAKLDKEDEELWIQILARPVHDDWHRKGARMAARIKRGRGLFGGSSGSGMSYAAEAFAALVRPPTGSGETKAPEISERDKSRISAIEEKSNKLGYQVKIRLLYAGHDQHTARLRVQALVGAFKQFNTTNLNGFISKASSFNRDMQLQYQTRFFIDKGYILNIEELASLFHLPHTTVETPNILWATTKTAEPPPNVPIQLAGNELDISLLGVTNFRGTNTVFGFYRADRGRHVYILGQTGTGKSGALELLTLSDIYYDQGFAVIDPHGDYAQHILSFIPEHRLDDVVYFNPVDTSYPIGFNPLEINDPSLKGHISSELVGVLKRLFSESWGPRLEYILRYSLLALLDLPNSTMLDITRLLTDKKFRTHVITYIDDPVVKNFWVTEFASWNDKFAAEAVAPVLNKVGAFTANPMIRNIIGQPKSTFNIRKIMDEGKILVVNLSRGLMGEDNAGILGAMMVTKIQLAAMGRADMPMEERRPFYLYVDEFQNFATDSFATILSEARKYGLNLTVANQYISQMSEEVRSAVFGNVGTIVCFRISPDDAPFLQKYFEPQFEAPDLIQQHSRFFVTTMMINDEKAPAFSAKTLNLPTPRDDLADRIVALSRERYTQEREAVEKLVRQNAGLAIDAAQQQPAPTPVKPRVQAQINHIDSMGAQQTQNQELRKVVGANILQSLTSDKASEPSEPRKRRRGKRGGRKHKKGNGQAPEPIVVHPGNRPSDEEVLHLR
ncbi:MAG: type IV secretory system conjugative DNA transfer family protein [Candidatus Saccharimonadales bacterium]